MTRRVTALWAQTCCNMGGAGPPLSGRTRSWGQRGHLMPAVVPVGSAICAGEEGLGTAGTAGTPSAVSLEGACQGWASMEKAPMAPISDRVAVTLDASSQWTSLRHASGVAVGITQLAYLGSERVLDHSQALRMRVVVGAGRATLARLISRGLAARRPPCRWRPSDRRRSRPELLPATWAALSHPRPTTRADSTPG